MKYKLKYIGIGLFIAGFIVSLGERFEIPYIESGTNSTHYEEEIASLNKTIATLKKEVQLLNEDLSTYTNKEKNEKESSSSIDSKKPSNSSSKLDVVTGTIYVYESISLYDIGRQAEDLNIIENGRELELFLAKPEYSRSIQKGTFELSSDMTLEQMAKILTGKK